MDFGGFRGLVARVAVYTPQAPTGWSPEMRSQGRRSVLRQCDASAKASTGE